MKFSFALVALFAGYVLAADIPPCVDSCSKEAAASSGCGDGQSKACVCDSEPFNKAAESCITGKCSIDDQIAALNLKNQLCGTQCHVITNVSSRICPLLLGAPKSGDRCKLLCMFTELPNERILIWQPDAKYVLRYGL
ncbi:hypothetical protein FS749_009526 [Ceratobasidium sp. UAMH 11750]|nr:hypothetical protein FS749_009526 [Ceratobasidium sp. UAMH 11750]